MNQAAQERFFELVAKAPNYAQTFLLAVHDHYQHRNNAFVRFTHTGASDMRLWANWEDGSGTSKRRIFGTMAWRPRKELVFMRCKLTPAELTSAGIKGSRTPSSPREPQNSEISFNEAFLRYHLNDCLEALERARAKVSEP